MVKTKPDVREYGNIIRVAEKPASAYVFAILLAMQPDNYEKYGEIKIQVTVANLSTAEYLIKLFSSAGLEEISREKTKIKVSPASGGQSYVLPNAYEITLEKHPALRH